MQNDDMIFRREFVNDWEHTAPTLVFGGADDEALGTR